VPSDLDRLAAAVRASLRDELRLDVAGLDLDTPLVTGGLLDSVALVRLAAHLERRCGVRIPDRDLTTEHFDSIRSLSAYLARRGATV
jgi:acyl carrier protein